MFIYCLPPSAQFLHLIPIPIHHNHNNNNNNNNYRPAVNDSDSTWYWLPPPVLSLNQPLFNYSVKTINIIKHPLAAHLALGDNKNGSELAGTTIRGRRHYYYITQKSEWASWRPPPTHALIRIILVSCLADTIEYLVDYLNFRRRQFIFLHCRYVWTCASSCDQKLTMIGTKK